MMMRWKSHKTVEAGKIQRVHAKTDYVDLIEVGGKQYEVEPSFTARGTPEIGDYLVRYEDGYLSWSPAKAFEEGYDLLLEDEVEDDVQKDGSVDENGVQS
jgi:hypothetical protein